MLQTSHQPNFPANVSPTEIVSPVQGYDPDVHAGQSRFEIADEEKKRKENEGREQADRSEKKEKGSPFLTLETLLCDTDFAALLNNFHIQQHKRLLTLRSELKLADNSLVLLCHNNRDKIQALRLQLYLLQSQLIDIVKGQKLQRYL